MTIGERIKQRRKSLGMSAETVAEKLGVSPATIYRYEKGDIEKLNSEKLKPIAEILCTTPADLMGWEDEEMGDEEREMWAIREALRRDPNLRVLFDLSRNATPSDVRAAIAVLKSLKGGDNE